MSLTCQKGMLKGKGSPSVPEFAVIYRDVVINSMFLSKKKY